jgi:hypothetical protein
MPWNTWAYDTYTVTPNSLDSVGIYRLIGINSYADAGMPSLPGMPMPSPFLHCTGTLPWGVSEELLKRPVKLALMDDRVSDILKPNASSLAGFTLKHSALLRPL